MLEYVYILKQQNLKGQKLISDYTKTNSGSEGSTMLKRYDK